MQSNNNNNASNRIVHGIKAYDNKKFIHSPDGRILRILSEYLYPEQHFRKHGIKKTVIFFGSARIRSKEQLDKDITELNSQLEGANPKTQKKLQKQIEEISMSAWTTRYYEEAYSLSKQITLWSNTLPKQHRLNICTGGGPGIMEAANRGSFDAGGKNIGLNISLPFEQQPNPYISNELNFEFHYFFMRKFWLVYLAQALIVFPGGFGTVDELMEILTLRQTMKMSKPRLILLYSKDYWEKIINFDYLAKAGMISQKDLNLFKFVNSPEEAFENLKKHLIKRQILDDKSST